MIAAAKPNYVTPFGLMSFSLHNIFWIYSAAEYPEDVIFVVFLAPYPKVDARTKL
ncbi:hypothetical protein [Acinetobacter amyesii]|uniref:hypothetical protein n=1 Tax=Acinetobacter amyesii TaxID=2942470 RepID=UPI0020BD5D73|nr:hypothetical protein [Acinetobacter amyesii]MCL6232913.1 hypothetical protein [Acinetobacter amyesii]